MLLLCTLHYAMPIASLFFFFLMIPRPPRSTLFPTRRSSDLLAHLLRSAEAAAQREVLPQRVALGVRLPHQDAPQVRVRSEEHTSELQSQSNLVCRLLLEKKKQKKDVQSKLTQYADDSRHSKT